MESAGPVPQPAPRGVQAGDEARERTVYVGAGSNVDPAHHLRLAIRELRARFGAVAVSPVYRSPAVGFEGEAFLNLVLSFRTDASAPDVVAELERLHRLAGRVRGPEAFSPRTLDLDLLLYGDEVITGPAVRVPRADIEQYAFVLKPLADLAPALRHPVDGRTMAELWAAFDASGHPLEPVAVSLD